ncbi:hypothetical protein WA158_004405 [Blastocystis sp. Blastoise]
MSLTGAIIVDRNSICSLKNKIIKSINDAHYISFDAEFTGLSTASDSKESDVEKRYTNHLFTVKQFGLLRLGITCIENLTQSEIRVPPKYTTYEFVIVPDKEYKITTSAFLFLLNHNIDLNYQFKQGIVYPGQQYLCSSLQTQKKKPVSMTLESDILLDIMNTLLTRLSKDLIPLIVHNGWIDLLFLYYNFWGPLQSNMNKSINALHKLFPCVYDTKYIMEQLYPSNPSFLEFCFLYSWCNFPSKQLKNMETNITVSDDNISSPSQGNENNNKNEDTQSSLIAGNNDNTDNNITNNKISGNNNNNDNIVSVASFEYQSKRTCKEDDTISTFCDTFIKYGWCAKKEKCNLSHDIAAYLISIYPSTKDMLQQLEIQMNSDNYQGYHSAGFDAYCTGYIFMNIKNGNKTKEQFKNLLCLPGKDIPLTLRHSEFP